MKIVSKLLCSIWAITLLVVLNVALPVGASVMSTILCGDQMQVSIAYDGASSSTFGYDSAIAHAESEKENRTGRTEGVFDHFADLVAAKTVATPYGPAVQSMTAEARAALSQVESGATLYKGGVLGRSETGASQFLSLENPLNPGYAGRYGIPPQNANFEFILTGRVQPGASVITRPAPGIPPNPGGGIEAVTTPGSFRIDSFHMP